MVMDQGAGTARQHMERLRELEAEIDARLA
jgi:hypothetical protein